MTDANLPAAPLQEQSLISLLGKSASPAMQIMLNDKLFDRMVMVSKYMSRADGMIPKHLINKPEACFAVIVRSMTWKLDPYAVAGSTYQTPGGSVGYEGKLCQAVLENSGMIEGQVKFEHFGDWSKVQAKFTMEQSQNSKGKYARPAWKAADEEGLGVIVSAQVKGEAEPRTLQFLLKQAQPRNSTLWATDPMTQICYIAVRRFANTAAPGIFMGVPFDREDLAEGTMVDITPAAEQPKARPSKAAAKAGNKDMDAGFKATVGAPTAGETVVEDTPAHDDDGVVVEETAQDQQQDAPEAQEPEEIEDAAQEQQGDQEGEGAGEQDEEEPAAETPADPPAKAETPPVKEAPPVDLMPESEAKAFHAACEKYIVKFTGDVTKFDKWKEEIRLNYRRLKAAFPDRAKKLSEMIGAKGEALKEKAASADSMD